jgi:hypothetical protein
MKDQPSLEREIQPPAAPLPIPGAVFITNAVDREPNPAARHIISWLESKILNRVGVYVEVDVKTLERWERKEWTEALEHPPSTRLVMWATKQHMIIDETCFTIGIKYDPTRIVLLSPQ